ncbi:hypothetical protein [Dolichospermum sp. LEGE 00246]|uniref:hypothetical protein n=1 Tax=Dolichospermum sp. LEGE 00246 TaxID=1828605 RepID=UPI00187E21B4|nr:hypothetical protein [Dolichospermum sp. LEGE 00246]MBE9258514.1 hypothetical protein [Dolichospermum sp. LEGE 00246]
MKTLIDFFDQNEPHLRQELKKVQSSPFEIASLIQSEIYKFVDINGEYIANLTPPQARVAIAMLTLLSLSFESIIPVNNSIQNNNDKVSPDNTEHFRKVLDAATTATLAGGVAGGVAVNIAIGTGTVPLMPFVMPIALITSGVVLVFKLSTNYFLSEKLNEISKPEIDVDKLVLHFKNGLEIIDRDVSYIKPPKIHEPKLEDHSDVLDCLQNLLGEANNEIEALPLLIKWRIEQLTSILKVRYQIDIKYYEEEDTLKFETGSQNIFDFEKSFNSDFDGYKTKIPAFIKDGQVLRQGRVTIPFLEPSENDSIN